MKTALVSVSDKTGIETICRELIEHGYRILSTGGTASLLRKSGITVTDVSEYTGFPEMMDGRVKTLHPKVHGGLLALRDNPEHCAQAQNHGISMIDCVIVNLYPFESVSKNPDSSFDTVIENIDIGGPAMIRSASKNYRSVAVITDPADYPACMQELKVTGEIGLKTREKLACKAFGHTAAYDSQIEKYLKEKLTNEQTDTIKLSEISVIGRYAENWHQTGRIANFKEERWGVAHARQLHGTEPGYNNYLDLDSAFQAVREHKQYAACVVKHGNPCGLAVCKNKIGALERAWQGDPVSAFGSVIAVNFPVDEDFCRVLSERKNSSGKKGWFVECIGAPAFTDDALKFIQEKKSKRNLRLFEISGYNHPAGYEIRGISGGLLMQERDSMVYHENAVLFGDLSVFNDGISERKAGIASAKRPDESLEELYWFAYAAVKHVKSNAIVIAREFRNGCMQILGMGAGQPNRRESTMLALMKAEANLRTEYQILISRADEYHNNILTLEQCTLDLSDNFTEDEYVAHWMKKSVLASDAFFPFTDALIPALEMGIRNIIQPGGSTGDEAVVACADSYNAAMIFTGIRHFRH